MRAINERFPFPFGVWVLFAMLLVDDCASLPAPAATPASLAFDRPHETRLGRQALASAQAHGNDSGFFVQDTGAQAFLQRAALIEAAERSIDAQYYIWNSDVSGRYWNSRRAYPIDTLANPAHAQRSASLKQLLAQARTISADTSTQHYTPVQQANTALVELTRWFAELEWAPAELVFSEPTSEPLSDGNTPARTAARLGELMRVSEREILMESAYFILGRSQFDGARQLTARGVTLKALTNSLASNDLVGNHAGYARSRKGILSSGIELYELRPDAQDCAQWRGQAAMCNGSASLHSKTMVFDRSVLYVGSFNLNLRSIYLNGETVLIVHSPPLAERVAQAMERAMQPANSWQVELDDNGALQWTGRDGVYDREPATGLWRRFKARFWRLFPIEKYY
ncbi:MAG: phospholipase D-like domain-containing protein [Gammaproteobacteria bacterium]